MSNEIANMFVSIQSFEDGLRIDTKIDLVDKEEGQHERSIIAMLGKALAKKYIKLGFRVYEKHGDTPIQAEQ